LTAQPAAKLRAKLPLHFNSPMFRKILIANRGEIAVRILRACRELGIRSAAVFSEVDRNSLHVRLADEAYPIGPAPSAKAICASTKLWSVARRAGCDAIIPATVFSQKTLRSRAPAPIAESRLSDLPLKPWKLSVQRPPDAS
jgi:hypothetical protein